MMSRLMQHYLAESGKHLTILTATSGDTGSAVASAFAGLKNIKVIILFPENEVSLMQRMQMTTLGGNIKVVAVDGKFDDCQAMVKKAFLDPALSHLPLSSANSINIGRLLPQAVYYFYSWLKLSGGVNDKAVFSVPSGNFGNLTAGLIAARMGLPAEKFIISTNANDEVPEFLRKGTYKPLIPSRNCISSAMNVGHPSNLARLIAFYGGNMNEKGIMTKEPDLDNLRKDFYGISVSDEKTRKTIAEVYSRFRIILEPHGAAAWYGLNDFLNNEKPDSDHFFISLETAHPAKFSEEIERILGFKPPLPPALSGLTEKKEEYLSIEGNYEKLREFIFDSNNQ
jgi:threonine synthase